MKKWITDHPYIFTSIIFLIIVLLGRQVFYWQEENYTFLLLLYFIVTLGIRLDDISRKIGGGTVQSSSGSGEKETIIRQLNDIKVSLSALNSTLGKLVENTKEEKP